MLTCAALWGGVRYSSSAIAVTALGDTVVAVNPTSNSASIVHIPTRGLVAEIPVGIDPRAVAVDDRRSLAYVANQGSDTISIIDLGLHKLVRSVPVGYRPAGVAVSPDGRLVAVAELGDDSVRLLDAESLATVQSVAVADRPCGLAFTPDGGRLLVTHLLSGEVTVIALEKPARVAARVATWLNTAPAPSVIVSESGARAYLPQTTAHGQGLNTQFDNTVFAKVSVLNLESLTHQTTEHISLPEKDQPVGLPWEAALIRGGGELWVLNAASNDVSVLDISNPIRVRRAAHIAVGDNPRGIVASVDESEVYVNNTLAGTVSVIDAASYRVVETVTITEIPLPPVLLRGKRLFHSSAREELSQARWISCNTCHIDGEHDGRTWQLPYTGSVPAGRTAVIRRNTTSLLGMIETYPLRWSAEWDESADSEFSIRFEQFGTGLIQGGMNPTLGAPNQGRSYDLDCLAAFLDSLAVRPRRRALTAAEQRGKAIFESPRTECARCHPAPLYTDLKVHDVGTADGDGEWFGPLIDTPTLRFVYDSAPYLHDGSAATLKEVLTTANKGDRHGVTSHLTEPEIEDLAAFLLALPYQ